MCSASHLIQMDCHPSAVGTFLEAVLKCRPTPHIKSCLLKVQCVCCYYYCVYLTHYSTHTCTLIMAEVYLLYIHCTHVYVQYMYIMYTCTLYMYYIYKYMYMYIVYGRINGNSSISIFANKMYITLHVHVSVCVYMHIFLVFCYPFLLPPPPPPQYLGKTHNYWHGAVLLLEERATQEGELSLEGWTPPPYDGNYSDEILDPLKHVRV